MWEFLLNHTPLFYLTQSLWRDEAFSILVAEKPISSFIGKLNFEPPLYYILLHFWIKLFGSSEVATRSLSLIGFSLATIVIIFWAEKIFQKHFLSWFLPILFFVNPMLLYYGFEVRAYGWLMFFSALSLYAYSEKNWKLLALANVGAFYTHSYGILLPFVEGLMYLWEQKNHLFQKKFLHFLFKDQFIRYEALAAILIAPWLLTIINEIRKLRSSWYFPVDLQLVKSVLGNMFTGYDGTPGGLWKYTFLLSLFLLTLFVFAVRYSKKARSPRFLFTMIILPLVIVVGISFFKPLFVNRYLIFVTIAEVMLLGYAIEALSSHLLQKTLAVLMLLFSLLLNFYFPSHKPKGDIRTAVAQANMLRRPGDVLYVTTPLFYFETEYYTPDRQNVFLYNPKNNPFPWYVGDIAFNPQQMAANLPEFPHRAYIIHEDRSISVGYRLTAPPVAWETR